MARTVTILLCLGLIIITGDSQETWECGPPCKCKWASGKKTAECVRQNFTQIPDYLSPEIQNLELAGNRIAYLSESIFSLVGLVNLHKLNMRDCGIEVIHKNAFMGLKIVIELDLSDNHITKLSPGTFLETQRLRVLLMNHNRLEYLETGLFHNLEYLQKIEISNNQLERISEKTFKNLPGLQSLTLDGNNLTNLKLATFDNLPKLGSLELHNNPWNCNCHLKKFRNWTIERKLYTKPTRCSQPATLAGKMWDEINSEEFACRPKIISIGPHLPLVVEPDESVTMWCHATGIPRPQLTWVHRSRVLNNSTRRHNGDSGGYELTEKHEWLNLTIRNLVVSDKGDYICIARNPGGSVERNVSLVFVGDAENVGTGLISLPLALGLGVTLLILILFLLTLCTWYWRRRKRHEDEKIADVTSLEHHGLGEQEKSLITAINPVVKPPRRYEAPSVTSHGTEMTELNKTLLDNDSVFAEGGGSVIGIVGGISEDEREQLTLELENNTPTRGNNYRQYPPDLLTFSSGRGASPTSQGSTVPDTTRSPHPQLSFGSPSMAPYPIGFKTLPHNRSVSSASYNSPTIPVMPRHGYVTIPRRPRAPSWSSGPPSSPVGEVLEPVYDNLGLRTTADGSSVLSLNKSPESTSVRIKPLSGNLNSLYSTIQRSTPNILSDSPVDRSAPEGAAEWYVKLPEENRSQSETTNTLTRKIPPRPPPKPKKKSTNGPLYEDEGEDGTEV